MTAHPCKICGSLIVDEKPPIDRTWMWKPKAPIMSLRPIGAKTAMTTVPAIAPHAYVYDWWDDIIPKKLWRGDHGLDRVVWC